MPTMRRSAIALMAAGVLALGACSSEETTSTAGTTQAPGTTAGTMADAPMVEEDIVEVAVANGNFTVLADLLTQAGLVETLKGDGPFTVFAPTDEAFAKVDQATLDALAADPELLKTVLTYHVVSGKVTSDMVETGSVDTVAGEPLEIVVEDGKVMVGDATVTTADVMASNGVIHVIDTVLIPPSAAS